MTFQPGQSGNPAGRPKGSINKQLAMLRDAVEQVLPLVVERALGGDAEAQKLILERGLPKIKAVDAPVEFDLPEKDTGEQVRAILLQAASGKLSLPQVKEIVCTFLPLLEQEQQPAETPPLVQGGYMNAYLRRVLGERACEQNTYSK